MNFNANMVRDQANDALAIRCRQSLARIGEPLGQAVDPQPPIGVEHHFNDAGVVEIAGDRRPERGAQHPRAARLGLGSDRMNGQGTGPAKGRANRRPAVGAQQETHKYFRCNSYLQA